MKVLFVIPNMEAGGAERVMLNLLRHIDRSRFEPHLALMEMRGPHLDSIPRDVTIHHLGVLRARSAVVPIAKLCWKIRPRAVLSMLAYMNSAVIAARALMPKPVRILVREGTRTPSREVTKNRLRRWCYKHLYRRADTVICQSEFMKQEMQREFGLAHEKLARIYNPVNIELIRQLAREGENPFPDAGPNLVAVGRLSKEKGLELFLMALPLIRTALPGVKVTIVGQGPLDADLKNQTERLGLQSCVRFVGFQPNPYPFLSHAQVLVLPSRYEGLPNSALEALALGTFVVATNCTGALEEISSTTRRMRVAREYTPQCLAAAIQESLAEGAAAPQFAAVEPEFEARFAVSAVIAQYENLLSPMAHEYPRALAAEHSELKLAAK